MQRRTTRILTLTILTGSFFGPITAAGSSPAMLDDPELVYSTYLGGSGDDRGDGVAVDEEGNAYITGSTDSDDFPGVDGFQRRRSGIIVDDVGGAFNGRDAFVAKISPDGSQIVYSTFLNGEGTARGSGIAVDVLGRAHVVGSTTAPDFPTAESLQSEHGGGRWDAFVAILSADGSELSFSTFLGGPCSDYGTDIALDGGGDIYISGTTGFLNQRGIVDFMTDDSGELTTAFATRNAVQPRYGGGSRDAFVVKIEAGGVGIVYSTYFGGDRADGAAGITVSAAGEVYIAGSTTSQNLATSNAFQAQLSDSSNEAFIAKLDAGGATVLYASYHGGSGQDTATAVAVDRTGSVWIAGATGEGGGTEWAKYPTRNPIQAEHAGVFDAFLAKIAER